jgi:hypothetical protein
VTGLSGDDQDGSAELHLIVTDEGRGAVSTAWRYFTIATVLAAAGATVLVTSLGRGAGASTSAANCVGAPGYGGLGARLSAFDPNNNNSTGPAGPSPGTAFYTVTGTVRGCVTAFVVQDSTTPPLTARDLLILVSHPYLPGDAKQVVSTHSCAVWRSSALRRATGRAYARATAGAQARSVPGKAEIEATSNSTC